METFIGWILIITAITFFSWFIYGKDKFTVKENVRNFLLSEIFLITISIGAYMITGGNWKMNRTNKVVREIIYDHKSNVVTLYAHGPSGFKRPLSAQEIVKAIQCYPADATIEIDTITNADDIEFKRRKQRLELGNDVRNAIKGVLGIHSPSKKMMWRSVIKRRKHNYG